MCFLLLGFVSVLRVVLVGWVSCFGLVCCFLAFCLVWFVFKGERKEECEIACKYLKLHDTRSQLHIQGITRSYH